MLEIESLSLAYGAIQAVRGVTLHVPRGSIVALIGANGAGKTTLLRGISGLLRPASGRIVFEGKDIGGRPPEEIVRLGISHAPEGRQNFPVLTVQDNLLIGAYPVYRRQGKAEVQADLARVYSLFPVLRDRQRQPAGTLSGGEQQMLAIGRVLMARPRLALLDEPSMGLAPLVVRQILAQIRRLPETGATVLLVEQNARSALAIADRGYVIEAGRVVLTGTGEELRRDPRVRAAYLGRAAPKVGAG
ncbi:MAG TPA: ABC transporter ATP-binding protein [Methylomirabilota bacterium]|jgi:branched-chain amino acid transport system ATP-binding protein|nr:ABC transporter ATP-binding protein [Methylomirabilota bacterium]